MKGGLVKVFVRLRPHDPSTSSTSKAVRKTSETSVSVHDHDSGIYHSYPMVFQCDAAFDCTDSNRFGPLVSNAIPSSGNSIIIGYGHSGTGKTFSIFGPGGVLDAISGNFFAESVQVSFIEVYNEAAYDLLMPSGKLALMEDPTGSITVRNLTFVKVDSVSQLYDIVELGLSNRMVSPNAVHAFSSRSHAILQLKYQHRCVWLVDLAGSERSNPNNSLNSKISSREVNNIHKSLHALRRCIAALSSATQHLPARSSVLTRLIFSENVTSCLLIACITPDRQSVQETLSTLDFAGLCSSCWSPKKHTKSETQLLRYALAKLKEELLAERTRRIQLEREVGLLSSRSSTPSAGNSLVGTIAKLSHGNTKKAVDESSLIQNVSIKCSPVENRSQTQLFSTLDPNVEDSVLSQTWRHNQYDAILQKCWQN